MKNSYKKIILIALIIFFLVFIAAFQISFMNNFYWGFNIFLILILFLVLSKNTYGALFLGWIGGFLIDTAHFSVFGTSSLTLMLSAYLFAILQKKVIITVKNESVALIGITAVFSYHFLEWIINVIFISKQENFNFYFFNTAIVAESVLTVILLLVIFYFKRKFAIFYDDGNIINSKIA